MRHMKTVPVPATTKEVVDKTTCDFCGEKLKARRYERNEVTLQHEEGSHYPEGGSGTRTVFDCCSDCWDSKVMPALKALGASPRVEDWDY
jgi:hypothetical protein